MQLGILRPVSYPGSYSLQNNWSAKNVGAAVGWPGPARH